MRPFALFRLAFRVTRWLRQRLTPAGLVVVALTAFAAAYGLDTESNAAHQVFSLGAALLAVDAAACHMRRKSTLPRLAARRLLPDFVSADSVGRYRLEVRNEGGTRLPELELAEELAQPWPTAGDLARQRHRRAARFGSGLGYPAFLAALRRLRALDIAPIPLPPLLPGQATSLEVAMTATARGLASFERLLLVLPGPLGLIARRIPIPVMAQSLPVLPTRRQVPIPPASRRRQLQPGGIALAQHVGDSEEFRSLRDYRPGDPLRSIHWRSFARTGKPLVREFQEEYFARHALVLDTALPDIDSASFEAAVSIAAGLVARPRDADSLLDLLFVADRVHRLSSGRGLGSADTLLRVLAGVSPTPAATLQPLLATVLRHAPQASSIIVILLAWDEVRRNAVLRLQASGAQLSVLLVGSAPAGADLPSVVRCIAADEAAAAA